MILNEENCAPIIEGLLLAMVDDKRAVTLEANCLPGRVNWMFRVDINDTGKVIGIGGSHIRAMNLLVGLMGKQAGAEWHAVAMDPSGVERIGRSVAAVPKAFNATPDWTLLCQLLVALGINADVAPTGNITAGYTFQVRGSGQQDQAALLDMHAVHYKRAGIPMKEEVNVVGAIGTLFRAIARRQGVRYRLDAGA